MSPYFLHRVGYIDSLQGPRICAMDLKGLLKVVPKHGTRDCGSFYCINGFAIDQYGELLHNYQELYPALYREIIF